MSSKAVDALRAKRTEDSANKRKAVEKALADALAIDSPISVSAIADRAGVSRQFIYSHDDLKDALKAASSAPRVVAKGDQTGDPVEQGLRADQRTLMAKIERQRVVIADLRAEVSGLDEQRRRWLGAQLEQDVAVSPEDHAELRLACDRLMDENGELSRTVVELRRLVDVLESDLRASREAHAADVAALAESPASNVTGIRSRETPSTSD